jgi:hypothetical protein
MTFPHPPSFLIAVNRHLVHVSQRNLLPPHRTPHTMTSTPSPELADCSESGNIDHHSGLQQLTARPHNNLSAPFQPEGAHHQGSGSPSCRAGVEKTFPTRGNVVAKGRPPVPKRKEESAPGSLQSASSWQRKGGRGGEWRRRDRTWARCNQQAPGQGTRGGGGGKERENGMLGGRPLCRIAKPPLGTPSPAPTRLPGRATRTWAHRR